MRFTRNEEKENVASFTKFTNDSGWVYGVCGKYQFEAKLFDEGSFFGINDGRVSKLSIIPKGKTFKDVVVNYDRGWDIRPNKEVMSDYKQIMELLENSPKRFS